MPLRLLLCFFTFLTVQGCGQLPDAQGRSLNFNVTNFRLAARMAYTSQNDVAAQVPSISRSADEASAFLRNLIMRSVEEVLEQQGRSAFLSDAVISTILQQLTINITYTPLPCNHVFTVSPMNGQMFQMNKENNCYIIDGMVTNLCVLGMGLNPMNCDMNLQPIPQSFMTISGTFRTTNIIMANWSRAMWQSVLNRVARVLSSGPFSTYFMGAVVTLS